jgi:type VII secretion-associated protein (TIGR03931 family)
VTLRVAVDFGTSSTCVVASINGREPQVVVMDGRPLLSSAVYAASDGTLFVGHEAERQAAVDPSRYEPNPKRRIDEGELLLGDRVLPVVDVVHAVLARAVSEARRVAGGAEVDLLVLTHPADWGAMRTRLLRQAAGGLAQEVALVPEPVAAAVFHAATHHPAQLDQDRTVEFSGQPGDTLAVLDLGGGTVDVSVVRRLPRGQTGRRGGFQVLATRGDPSFGGADIDQALLEHVGSMVSDADPDAWRQLVEGRELADRRRRRVLRQDVRGAKETLSRHAYTDVPMPPPFPDAHVTREDLERLVAGPLGRAVELACSTIEEAGTRPKQLTAIFLVGGSSRIPMVSRLLHERTGVVPTTLDQPETVVARGALRAVLVDPDRTGALPGRNSVPRGGGPSMADQRTRIVSHRDVSKGVRPVSSMAAVPGSRGGVRPLPPRPLGGQQGAPVFSRPGARPASAGAPVRAARTHRIRWGVGLASVLVLAVGAVLVFALAGSPPPAAPEGRTFAQYDYKFIAPPGWTQTGDNAAAKQVVVKPDDAQSGDDLVVVQEILLAYNGEAERDRLASELRTLVEANSATHGAFDPNRTYAGKQVIYYEETKPAATVDWYVMAGGHAQVLVGCQYTVAQQRVAPACEQIVRTLEVRT